MMQTSKRIAVKDHPNLYRDENSKAIINTDINALNEYRQRAKLANDTLENTEKIGNLEKDISEIKVLLMKLINKE
jgi:dephospho-CoA kinase